MEEGSITVVSVNWYSSEHLGRLTENLLEKAENPENIRFLIIDNSAGEDSELAGVFNDFASVQIQSHDPKHSQRSIAHASALDRAFAQVESEFVLAIDPDVHVFLDGWDSFCVSETQSGKVAVGAPYPKWKLGKMHDSPSVVFFFGRTEWFKSVSGGWYPFPSSLRWGWNFVVRKIVRLFGFATRRRLEMSGLIRGLTGWLEGITGVTSPDTGWRFSKAAIESGAQSTVFEADFEKKGELKNDELSRLALNFELFSHSGKPFLTHMYSSGIAYYRTNESGNLTAWLSAISEVEGGLA
ncbi:MAG: hypothetical protein VX822_04825 [Candidatus Neomarinimicrobiota bacterium]|nr:hypothetical protein [Candidatus Neomarinimicrobiota bacterium]